MTIKSESIIYSIVRSCKLQLKFAMVWFALYTSDILEPNCIVHITNMMCTDIGMRSDPSDGVLNHYLEHCKYVESYKSLRYTTSTLFNETRRKRKSCTYAKRLRTALICSKLYGEIQDRIKKIRLVSGAKHLDSYEMDHVGELYTAELLYPMYANGSAWDEYNIYIHYVVDNDLKYIRDLVIRCVNTIHMRNYIPEYYKCMARFPTRYFKAFIKCITLYPVYIRKVIMYLNSIRPTHMRMLECHLCSH